MGEKAILGFFIEYELCATADARARVIVADSIGAALNELLHEHGAGGLFVRHSRPIEALPEMAAAEITPALTIGN